MDCLPVIEIERRAIILKDHGRLQAIMGTGYWDAKNEVQLKFHAAPDADPVLIDAWEGDPFDITIDELNWITKVEKRVERVGTVSSLVFFNFYPEDKKRIELLARMWHKLTHNVICGEAEVKALLEGHQAFMDRKNDTGFSVIK